VEETLIIFTRYPEVGKTKTRLIPALGAEGAAQLHCQLAEKTLIQARELQTNRGTDIEVHFTGGDRLLMQNWLGSGIAYQKQAEGNLGERMAAAFQMVFNRGDRAIVTIGTDCPQLNAPLLAQAFEQLTANQVVLGAALDGGYYLIGLQRFIPELFIGINWSTEEVWQQTMAIVRHLNLSFACLPPLADIDRPEDLKLLGFGC